MSGTLISIRVGIRASSPDSRQVRLYALYPMQVMRHGMRRRIKPGRRNDDAGHEARHRVSMMIA
jgi:hypothetical protein